MYEIIDNKCAYCGEDKTKNRDKHIQEFICFLQDKLKELFKLQEEKMNEDEQEK